MPIIVEIELKMMVSVDRLLSKAGKKLNTLVILTGYLTRLVLAIITLIIII